MSKITIPQIRKDNVGQETIHNLVKEIADLRYDRLVQFFDYLSNEIQDQSMLCHENRQLSARLSQISDNLSVVSFGFQAAMKAPQ